MQGHLVDFVAVRQEAEGVVPLDVGQDEIAGPVNGAVAAGAAVCKTDNPFYLRRLLPDQADGLCDAVALRVPGKVVVKGHAVEFQKAVPGGSLYQADDLLLVQAGAIAQDAVEASVEKGSEVEAGVIHDLAAVMVRADEWVCDLGGYHPDLDFFCSTHSFTTM